jgi:hypothetical protein
MRSIFDRLFKSTVIISFLFIYSCKPSTTSTKSRKDLNPKSELIKEISITEDSLHQAYEKIMANEVDSIPYSMIHRIEEKYISFYQKYKKDSLAPIYLDRLQQLYLQDKKYLYAVNWVDTIVMNYPSYKGVNLMLYNAGNTADMYLNDTNRVKKYYNTLLERSPKLKNEIRSELKYRLSHLSKSILTNTTKSN